MSLTSVNSWSRRVVTRWIATSTSTRRPDLVMIADV